MYRSCRAGGQWTALDLTNCTARPGASSFALLWMRVRNLLEMNDSQVLSSVSAIQYHKDTHISPYAIDSRRL